LTSLSQAALSAVRKCNPLRIPAQFQPYYEQWKVRRIRFDPEEMG
jgi:colicin import membrane protein